MEGTGGGVTTAHRKRRQDHTPTSGGTGVSLVRGKIQRARTVDRQSYLEISGSR